VNAQSSPESVGYQTSHRIYEWCCISIGLASFVGLLFRMSTVPWHLSLGCVVALPAAFLFADAVSGLVHWGFDTFGSPTTPVVGALAIRTFREHHADPKAMLKHDFVETNGHNIGLAIVVSASGHLLLSMRGLDGGVWFCIFACLLVSFTSQVHKWAHAESVPKLVSVLQRLGILLRPASHAIHHVPPHTSHYFIACGWLNPCFAFLSRVLRRR
jgi:plasmanylethanolamine desaturase